MIAILEAKRASLLFREHWMNNILAGVIVSVVELPPAMAFSITSGVNLSKLQLRLVGCLAVWCLRFYWCCCPRYYQYSQRCE